VSAALLGGLLALAAGTLSPSQQRQLADLQAQTQQALSTQPAVVGNPVWSKLLAEVRVLATQAPAPQVLLLKAQIYTDLKWWIRAKSSWAAYAASVSQIGSRNRAAYADVLDQLGYSLLKLRKPQTAAALRDFQEAVSVDPSDLQARYNLADAYLRAGQVAESLAAWQSVLAQDPSNARAQYFIAVDRRLSEFGRAAAAAFGDGYDAYQKGNYPAAKADFARAVAAAPGFRDAWLYLGHTNVALGRYASAVHDFRQVEKLGLASAAVRYDLQTAEDASLYGLKAVRAFQKGYDLAQQGHLHQAEVQFALAVSLSPAYEQAWDWVGRVHYQLGEYASAAVAYHQALQLDPQDAAAKYWYAQAEAKASGSGG
jgi:tetratricopeptide (TPR) repeat protein